MARESLNSAEKKRLRGMGQRLKPHIHVGHNGLTPNVLEEIDRALSVSLLIKVRFDGDRDAIRHFCSDVPQKLACEYVGSVGRTALFFRERSDTNE